jgi:hypothetical protein
MRQRSSNPISPFCAAAVTGFLVASLRQVAPDHGPPHASAVWTLNGLAAGIVGTAAAFLLIWAIYRRVTTQWTDVAFLYGALGAEVGFEDGSVIATFFIIGVTSLAVGLLLRGMVRRRGWWGHGPD